MSLSAFQIVDKVKSGVRDISQRLPSTFPYLNQCVDTKEKDRDNLTRTIDEMLLMELPILRVKGDGAIFSMLNNWYFKRVDKGWYCNGPAIPKAGYSNKILFTESANMVSFLEELRKTTFQKH